MNIQVRQIHPMHADGLVYAQRYSSYKEVVDARRVFPFTNVNIESLLIPTDLLQLWVRAGGTLGRSSQIQKVVTETGLRSYLNSKARVNLGLHAAKSHSFGIREEYRISWALFHKLQLNASPSHSPVVAPYSCIPTSEGLDFVRWELNRWLGAFETLYQYCPRRTPETGAMGVMLAQVIQHISRSGQYGLPYDLYKSSWVSKKGLKWRGLSFGETIEATGMLWLLPSLIDWSSLLFHHSIQDELRFFNPTAKQIYKRTNQVGMADHMYRGVDQIARFFGSRAQRQHQLERLRRICFLALAVQVLEFDVKNQAMDAPKDLEAYNYGICYRWLEQHYTTEFYIPHPWRVGTVWKMNPSWADLLQQLFDWDDQQKYKIPFRRDRWDRMQFRLITRHAYDRIQERLGAEEAMKWKDSLGLHAARFIWMIPKCTANRFKTTAKKAEVINGVTKRKHVMSWYSTVHSGLADLPENEEIPSKWAWQKQKSWNWEDCKIMKFPPQKLFEDLAEFDFGR
jgi:hypothetical protein